MKLKKLLKELPTLIIKGTKEVEITGICANSKLVGPGNLFVARKGRTFDGSKYIPEAIKGGAVAILTDIFDPTLKDITQIIHPNVGSIESFLAAQYHQFPAEHLFMVGITGTNGKTTTSYLIKHLLDQCRGPTGLIGTIEYIIGGHSYEASHTTPDVSTNQKLLREMVSQKCQSAVMEVTSHALDQGRADFIEYDVAIFTNLTHDHLDYHKTMEEYAAAKNKLFRSLGKEKKNRKKKFPKAAIVNADDPYCATMIAGCEATIITYGIDHEADLKASNVTFDVQCTHFDLSYKNRVFPCSFPLIGRYNVYNCLATIGCGLSQGFLLETIIDTMKTFVAVPGRLEPIANNRDLSIFVDFAHTPDALLNVLKCLKEFKKGRIITVFGCGGDRDPTKRPYMAEVAENYSDICIVTSDNPRSEVPETIIKDIIKGFRDPLKHKTIVDRKEAIAYAIDSGKPGDIILIAGRGHETQQTFAHHTVEFDDRVVVKEVL